MDVVCEEQKEEKKEKRKPGTCAISLWHSMQRIGEARLVIKHINVTADPGLQELAQHRKVELTSMNFRFVLLLSRSRPGLAESRCLNIEIWGWPTSYSGVEWFVVATPQNLQISQIWEGIVVSRGCRSVQLGCSFSYLALMRCSVLERARTC